VDVTHLRLLTAASLPALDGSGDIDDDGGGSSGWGVLQALCRLTTEGGRTLPGLVLLEIVDGFLATQPEDRAEKFLMAWGGLAALLGVVAGRRGDDTVRARARASLLRCVARYECAREGVVRSYAALVGDLSALSLPAVAAAAVPSSSSSSSSVAHLMTMCDVEWVVQQRRSGPDAGTESGGGRAAAAAVWWRRGGCRAPPCTPAARGCGPSSVNSRPTRRTAAPRA
jgi:hypothetical protein